MPASFTVLLAQIQPRLGQLDTNLATIEHCLQHAPAADLVVFPELALTGSNLQDRWLYPHLEQTVAAATERLAALSQQRPFLIGLPMWSNGELHNSCALFAEGQLHWHYHKQCLSTDLANDERRYFSAAVNSPLLIWRGQRLGIALSTELQSPDVLATLKQHAPTAVINLAADAFYLERPQQREQQLSQLAQQLNCPLLWINAVGGQDEAVYDGHSTAFNGQGELCARAPTLVAHTLSLSLPLLHPTLSSISPRPSTEAIVYDALVHSLRDYVQACGFKGVVLGLSGGIDSALVLAVAVDALGAEQVTAVMMPYHYTAPISQEDAALQAQTMGVAYHSLPVIDLVHAFHQQLTPVLAQWPSHAQDTTEQNLQARSRGVLLMGMSNRSGALLLTTSNKSEMAVGYCTLYGDMAGGFALLKDVPKTLVYRLAAYRNTRSPVIPERVITRPPTAELAPDQEDSQSLPPYPVLDEIIRLYVEQHQSAERIIAQGFDDATVRRVLRLIDVNEYKRSQSAMGPRITQRGFGRERRMPLSGY